MKALIVNPYWRTLGGGERYTASLIALLLGRGWQVDILSPQDFAIPVRDRFGIDIGGAGWLPGKYTRSLSLGYQALFWLSDGSLPLSWARHTVIHLQFPFTGIGGRSLSNLLKSRLYTFVVNSAFTKSFIDREFAVGSRVVHPPVDIDLFTPAVSKSKQILYVGRFSDLTQSKGQQYLIDTFRGVKDRLPGWRLVVAGGTSVGFDPARFRALTKSAAGLPVKIITDPDLKTVRLLYSKSKIFWSASGFGVDPAKDPTRVEHFGISVVEAMASGCVPVVSNMGGHREIVSQGVDGFLFDTLKELGDYTFQLAESPAMLGQLSKSACGKSKIFSTAEFNRKFLDILGL